MTETLLSGRLSMLARLLLILIAILLAILLHLSGRDWALARTVSSWGVFGAIIMGAFYTFGPTTPFAFMFLLEMMSINNFLLTALAAALAAAVVDTMLFTLVRHRLERDAREWMGRIHQKTGGHNMAFSVLGFFIFGSPLPDEFALALMEITEIRPLWIATISFLAKFTALLMAYWAVKVF